MSAHSIHCESPVMAYIYFFIWLNPPYSYLIFHLLKMSVSLCDREVLQKWRMPLYFSSLKWAQLIGLLEYILPHAQLSEAKRNHVKRTTSFFRESQSRWIYWMSSSLQNIIPNLINNVTGLMSISMQILSLKNVSNILMQNARSHYSSWKAS